MSDHLDVAVGFPWKSGDLHRDRAFRWVIRWWRENFPELKLLKSSVDSSGTEWCKARHIKSIWDSERSEIIVIADADVVVDKRGISAAIDAVRSGADWAVPHNLVYRLNVRATDRILKTSMADVDPLLFEGDCAQTPYIGHQCGGMVVMRREILIDVPPDPRFVGWGKEDDSWALALRALIGPAWRGSDARMLHFWHLPQDRDTRHRPRSMKSRELARQYVLASRSKGRMRNLVDEAKNAFDQQVLVKVRDSSQM